MDERLQQQLLLTRQKQTFTISLTRPHIHSIPSRLFSSKYFKLPKKHYHLSVWRGRIKEQKGKNEREMKGKDCSRGTKHLAHSGEYGIIIFLCKESLCTCYCHQRWVNLPVQLHVNSHLFIRTH